MYTSCLSRNVLTEVRGAARQSNQSAAWVVMADQPATATRDKAVPGDNLVINPKTKALRSSNGVGCLPWSPKVVQCLNRSFTILFIFHPDSNVELSLWLFQAATWLGSSGCCHHADAGVSQQLELIVVRLQIWKHFVYIYTM